MKKANILWAVLACTTITIAAWAQTTMGVAEILRQSRVYQLQFRSGQYEVAPQFVAMLEAGTKTNPENADLSNAMGVAYLAQVAGVMLQGGNPADAWVTVQKGMHSLERALELNPNHAEALATHGGVQAVMASFQKQPGLAAQGVAEMNRAVELAPKSARVRLARAFNGLSLPDTMRDHATEVDDLDFLAKVAKGTRQGDYIRLMLGDLHAELGNRELAAEQYEMAAKAASPAAVEAKLRLEALTHEGVSAVDIKKLRSSAGANCTMCHAN